MNYTKKIDGIIAWLTETDGGHAVGEGDIKCAVSDLRTLKQAFDNLACEAKHEKPQGIQWNKYPESKPKLGTYVDIITTSKRRVPDCEAEADGFYHREDDRFYDHDHVTHWAEINLPNH